jgi:hypothetical protein
MEYLYIQISGQEARPQIEAGVPLLSRRQQNNRSALVQRDFRVNDGEEFSALSYRKE